ETHLQGHRSAQGAGPALPPGGASYPQGRDLASLPGYPNVHACHGLVRPDLQRRADRTVHLPPLETESRRARLHRRLRSRQALGRIEGLAVEDRARNEHADGRQFTTNDTLTAKVTPKRAVVSSSDNRPISLCRTLT